MRILLSHETMRQGDNEKQQWGGLTYMRLREYHENLIVSWDHETRRQWGAAVRRVNIYETKRISWSPMLSLLMATSHCLLVSWSHETMRFSWCSLGLIYVNPPHHCFSLSPCLIVSWEMRFSWYSLGLIYGNPPHRCFSLSPSLMVSWDNEILMIFSWSPMLSLLTAASHCLLV